ncbi:acyltransferase family protein [Microbacterium sp. UBA3486]|uniref:acyltransferase family protein n=1 Tax=Microbacterium TaxID=33882 RepID=UPI0025FE29FC|nr:MULTISPECIES: acyltransferase family protein [Microbacterium]
MKQSFLAPSPGAAPPSGAASPHRADIDGLRALAILLVVVYHVWLGRVSGGVDVFLMVSAFFLTGSFVRRMQDARPLQLGAFWIRRFLRLVPAAAVTIAGVLAVALVAFPRTEWPRVWSEAWSSLFYVENWTLAFSEVDYYARASQTPSPFQHFWSLSVQGQVFLLWPVLFAGVWLALRNRRHLIVPALFAVFGAVFVVSLVFSIVETGRAQDFAYFDTRTRLWEFAAGSLIALALPFLRVRIRGAAVLGWIGVLGIVLCGIIIDVQGGFPGYLALWPIVSAGLVIVAGRERARGGPTAFLSSSPLRYVSRDAYALYLVHWPILVIWMVVSGRSEPGVWAGLGIIGLSFVIARLLSRFVERPIREARSLDGSRGLGAGVLVAAVLAVAVPLGVWQGTIVQRTNAIQASDSRGYPGAAQLDSPIDLAGVDLPLIPDPTTLDAEWVYLGQECSGDLVAVEPALDGTCTQTLRAAEPGTRRVLVMGDSHAQQLMSPLRVSAEGQDWELIALLRGGCSIALGAPSPAASASDAVSCEDWRSAAIDYALRVQPDAVYLVVTRASPASPEVLVDGIEDIASLLLDRGIQVIAVRDNPRFDFDMYACVFLAEETCDVPEIGFEEGASLDVLAERDGITAVDFRPWMCPDSLCLGVIGNVAVYIDDNHLSDAYGRTLAPMLQSMLDDGGVLASAGG